MQTVEAIYENKVLKPLTPLEGLCEHQRVELMIKSSAKKNGLQNLIGTLTKEEGDVMIDLIQREFEVIEEQ
jgi:predicted DNA-binding antitoxin AbrB/MazE fold protein